MAVFDRGDCAVVIYLDDIVIYRQCAEKVWAETLLVLSRLVEAGFTMKLNKSMFLVSRKKMLGHRIQSGCQKPISTTLQG